MHLALKTIFRKVSQASPPCAIKPQDKGEFGAIDGGIIMTGESGISQTQNVSASLFVATGTNMTAPNN
jgi:hypothetical protein